MNRLPTPALPHTLAPLALALALAVPAAGADAPAAFASDWPQEVTRVWAGRDYWTNPLQDWRIAGGRLECIRPGPDRNVHLLTRDLAEGGGAFEVRVRMGLPGGLKKGWAGFRVGIRGTWGDYRDSVRRGRGTEAGLHAGRGLFLGRAPAVPRVRPGRAAPPPEPPADALDRDGWAATVETEETKAADNRAANMLDGKAGTIWHSRYSSDKPSYPHEVRIDLGERAAFAGFAVLPRQDKAIGRFADWELYVSDDGEQWGKPVASGRFADTAALGTARFKPVQARHVRLVAKTGIVPERPACAIAELYLLKPPGGKREKPSGARGPGGGEGKALATDDVELRLAGAPDEAGGYTLTLSAHDPGSGRQLAETHRPADPNALVGNIALVVDAPKNARGTVWFGDWRVSGAKLASHPERAFGPVLWAQHTLSRGVLKMTAQMPPLGDADGKAVRLEVRDGAAWKRVATAEIHPLARTATFRVADWDDTKDTPYRVVYALREADGKTADYAFEGTVRRDPADKKTIVLAGFTGNADYAFPNLDLVRHVKAHDPDVLFFSGDNIYENVGGYGVTRRPLEVAVLDYLRKWYYFGWAYADLLRDRPCVSIPDDHDVYQGNLWGQGGRKAPKGINSGGYAMPAEWVKVVERTQTSNLPDPYDPTPVKQGIGVYYTEMLYGRVSFAVLEDRKFKTGPAGVVPKSRGRSDHVHDPDFDPSTADIPGTKLLGDRQLAFLRDWASSWRGADFKVALSQTVFANLATLHGGGLKRLVADYDSNGWPQRGRRKALDAMRRAFAFMVGGDQHLATICHHGIDTWGDAGWSMCVPSVANFYPRAWVPVGEPARPVPGDIPHTGSYRDGFGNPVTVYAHTNPREMHREPASLHDKMPGYGIVRFHKDTRKIDIECWPLFADPRDPETGSQYEGWPKTIGQLDNYARRPTAWLPKIAVSGMDDPVVQVRRAGDDGEIVYTLRINGRTFRPWVFEAGAYDVGVGEQGTGRWKVLEGFEAASTKPDRTVKVAF